MSGADVTAGMRWLHKAAKLGHAKAAQLLSKFT
jgi:TPR repeat protein|eukprot:COSAG01_NODE_11180_length_1989_cov_1.563492_3_plen_33_part_00